MSLPWPHARTIAALAIVGAGCSEPSPRPNERTAPDKAALFGDPTLVPTRAGELARRELASAGELAAVLRANGWLEHPHVDVEHAEPIRVVIAGTRSPAAPSELDAELRRITAAVLADDGVELVLAIAEPAAPVPTERRRELPLFFAALGLGASISLLLDRSWRRRARVRAARRRRAS